MFIDIGINNRLNNLSEPTAEYALSSGHRPVRLLRDDLYKLLKTIFGPRENSTILTYKHFNYHRFKLQLSELMDILGQIDTIDELERQVNILSDNVRNLQHPLARKIRVYSSEANEP